MSENTNLPSSSRSSDALIGISGSDAKAWELVQSVLSWMAERKMYNYAKAFRAIAEETGQNDLTVSSNYYNAIQRPYVRTRLLERHRAQDAATLELMEHGWLPVLRHQFEIATGRDGTARDAVAAARFLYDVRKDVVERNGAEIEEDADSVKSFLKQFASAPGKRKYKARRKRKRGDSVVEETIEVVSDGDEPDTIDVTPGQAVDSLQHNKEL